MSKYRLDQRKNGEWSVSRKSRQDYPINVSPTECLKTEPKHQESLSPYSTS
jgi:hypothetical protein